MNFEVVTLFPEFFERCWIGLLEKAITSEKISLTTISPREFATDKHKTVDDTPYGGGAGMVMMPGPVVDALEALDAKRSESAKKTRRILLSPQGKPFTQKTAERWSSEEGSLTFICGRYEGFDDRIRAYVDEEASLGDFVLLGGEVAAATMIEATARLLPGVIGKVDSARLDSHSTGLLEHPHYTRPAEFRGEGIPDVLLSGHHKNIEIWRRQQSLLRTAQRRSDLLENVELSPKEAKWLEHALVEAEKS